MRTAFIETLSKLAERNERVWLLTGDLGFSVVERFAACFPARFLNVGVAEQNLIGVAAGLALCGKVVFVYSIANFPTLRCLEQIRNDVCYHNLDVKIVSVGGGVAYGVAGYTHHAVEDLAVMSALPRMTVLVPGDPVETRLAVRALLDWPGPGYLRIGKAGEPVIHRVTPDFQIGKAIVMRHGGDVTLISTGAMLRIVLGAAEILQTRGVSARVLSMPTLKPFDAQAVTRAARETGRILCVEEHCAPGALFNAAASVIASQKLACVVAGQNLGEGMAQMAYSQNAYLASAGLNSQAIAGRVMQLCEQYHRAVDHL